MAHLSEEESYDKKEEMEGNIQLVNPDVPYLMPTLPNESHRKLTLDEPILETILRDIYKIGYKLKYVLNPKAQEEAGKELRNCWLITLI